MLQAKTRWKYPNIDEESVKFLQEILGISPLLAKLFQARGWTDVAEAQQMLETSVQSFHDPFLLKGMSSAVERVQLAIQQGEKIRIYGDYDCDGVTSTSLLYFVLSELGADFDFYIPNRFAEGYGVNKAAIRKAKEDGVQLIITVDTGITAKDEVAYAQELGLEFIITDHHEPPAELPACVAVLNPKLPDSTYPYSFLCGAGVALKFGHALLGYLPEELLDLAAIGTIADLVPLTGENRLIAYHGLKRLNRTEHIGVQALVESAGLSDQILDEQHVGFALGPRINASGRLQHAKEAVRLLISDDWEEAQHLAEKLDGLNKERQQLVDKTYREAVKWIEETYPEALPPFLLVAKEGWHEGVIGIVASKLVNKYYLPSIVLSVYPEKGVAKGSARSIEGLDIYQALAAQRELLAQFGGHTMAAGMSVEIEQLEPLRQALISWTRAALTEEDFIPLTSVDVSCLIEEVTVEAIEEVSRLAPYGVGNPKPVFLVEQVQMKSFRLVGADQAHLKCQLADQELSLETIGFGFGEVAHQISLEAKVDCLGSLSINEWNGVKKPQLMLVDLQIKDQQIFDWRGVKHVSNKWDQLAFDQQAAFCFFREKEQKELSELPANVHSFFFSTAGELEKSTCNLALVDTFILYDLPQSMSQLQHVLAKLRQAKRLYILFQQKEEYFFQAFPTREQFKWYYAFLKKQQAFHVSRDGEKLAIHKGWSLASLHLMSKVFLELEFATMKGEMLILQEQPVKRDLSSSQYFQQKKAEMELEQELIYSSFQDLKSLLEKLLAVNHEEAYAYGF